MSKITVSGLVDVYPSVIVLDVRKPQAARTSGLRLPGAEWRHPFAAEHWRSELDASTRLVVYCVHGHEVSQGVCGFLRDHGFDALWLEGGFEAWREAGHTVEPA